METFYKKCQFDYTTIDKTLLTQDLSNLIVDSENKENAETLRVGHCKFPNDNPLILACDIFISLYEGQNFFKMGK